MASESNNSSRRKRFRLRTWHVATTLVVLVVIAVIAASSYFVWNRWDRYDDSLSIQGTWYVLGTSVPIEITSNTLDFSTDTYYSYTLDQTDKTITFKLGNMDGLAHYCFFEGRQVLMIVDGDDFSRWGTAGDDLLISLQGLVDLSSGRIPLYPQGEGVIVLSRTPDKYAWGNYSFAYKDPADAPGASKDKNDSSHESEDQQSSDEQSGDKTQHEADESSNGSSGVSSGASGDEEETPNSDEGKPRADDPFASVSDILMTAEGA